MSNGQLLRPVDKKYPITAKFGQVNPILWPKTHRGIDYGVPEGSDVYAALDGEVQIAGNDPKGFLGLRVWIVSDKEDVRHLYAHNSKLLVEVGRKVQQGELIAYSGATGVNRAGKPVPAHLHFEVRRLKDDEPIQPIFA